MQWNLLVQLKSINLIYLSATSLLNQMLIKISEIISKLYDSLHPIFKCSSIPHIILYFLSSWHINKLIQYKMVFSTCIFILNFRMVFQFYILLSYASWAKGNVCVRFISLYECARELRVM